MIIWMEDIGGRTGMSGGNRLPEMVCGIEVKVEMVGGIEARREIVGGIEVRREMVCGIEKKENSDTELPDFLPVIRSIII